MAQARPLVWTHVGLPVVDTDAIERSRRVRIDEGDDGVVADGAAEHVAEGDDRPTRRSERSREAAAFAGVILGDDGVGKSRAVISRPGEG